MRRRMLVVGVLGLTIGSASAYDGFSPLSGPNTAIPSPVCDVINFGFCPQPPSPAIEAPDPNAVAPTRTALPAAPHTGRTQHARDARHRLAPDD